MKYTLISLAILGVMGCQTKIELSPEAKRERTEYLLKELRRGVPNWRHQDAILADLGALRADCKGLGIDEDVTDAGLAHLAAMSNLQLVEIVPAYNITDVGLSHLAKVKTLQVLRLSDSDKITDKGLEHLAKLVKLRRLYLLDCSRITATGVKKLQAALPKCRIER